MRDQHRPVPGTYPVRFGTAEVNCDLDWPNGWLLTVDGIAQSYIDLDDPTHLEFDYVRRIGDLIDGLPGSALDAVHVGGGACTLPRYVAATRPGSDQVVFDADGDLVDLVRAQFGLDVPELDVRVGDGRLGVAALASGSADLVVLDAFQAAAVPGGLATIEFIRDVARVLRSDGTVLANVSDGPGLPYVRRVLATFAAVFPHLMLLAEPNLLRGRRFGNIVLAASRVELPVAEIRARSAAAIFPARCVSGADLQKMYGDAAPLTDAAPVTSPAPPKDRLGLSDDLARRTHPDI